MLVKRTTALSLCLITVVCLFGCGSPKDADMPPAPAQPYDGREYIRESELTDHGDDLDSYIDEYEPVINPDSMLSVPTYITKVDDFWFIVDCYHNRVIYSSDLGSPLNSWLVMCPEVTQPHTMASDGKVYMIDDTENNRVLVYEKMKDKFIKTQIFSNVGNRPHFSVYDPVSDTFYVWSSQSGELYCFRHTEDSTRLYLTEIKKIDALSSTYVRSFTIIGGDIYFVSGISGDGTPPQILRCDLKDLSVKESYAVPDELAGMIQITPVDDEFYITVSTDRSGNQDYATLIRTTSLERLMERKYEDIYSEYFIGGGTPYNISMADGSFFLTEHRLWGHSIWRFDIDNGEIKNVQAIY
jgi:hypothetical protein